MLVRETVNFNPNILEHKADFKTLMEHQCLGRCKYRYNLEAPYLDIMTMMKERMLQYYLKTDV